MRIVLGDEPTTLPKTACVVIWSEGRLPTRSILRRDHLHVLKREVRPITVHNERIGVSSYQPHTLLGAGTNAPQGTRV